MTLDTILALQHLRAEVDRVLVHDPPPALEDWANGLWALAECADAADRLPILAHAAAIARRAGGQLAVAVLAGIAAEAPRDEAAALLREIAALLEGAGRVPPSYLGEAVAGAAPPADKAAFARAALRLVPMGFGDEEHVGRLLAALPPEEAEETLARLTAEGEIWADAPSLRAPQRPTPIPRPEAILADARCSAEDPDPVARLVAWARAWPLLADTERASLAPVVESALAETLRRIELGHAARPLPEARAVLIPALGADAARRLWKGDTLHVLAIRSGLERVALYLQALGGSSAVRAGAAVIWEALDARASAEAAR